MKAKKYQGGGKMKEMKKKNPSRLHTSKASRDRESYKRDVREGFAPLPFAGGLPKRMTDAEDRAATKKEREAAKKIKKMKKGGRMGLPKDISGMGRFGRKLKKLTPLAPKKIDSGVSMDKTLKKSAVEVDNKKKRRKKRRRKLEMGGTLSSPNVNLRGEGKKKKKKPKGYVLAPITKTDRPERMEKVTPRGPDVVGLAKKVKPGTIKKSSAKIPVPAKKKRRLRRK